MAYNVSSDFREQCYSGESLYSCRLIIGSQTIPMQQISSITISSPIIDDTSEIFYIGTFISQKLTIKFKNLDGKLAYLSNKEFTSKLPAVEDSLLKKIK